MNVPDQFIQSCLPAARAVKATYGVPIAVLIAQTAVETGWGQNVKGNSYFGVKYIGAEHGAAGIDFHTTEVINGKVVPIMDRFRAYTGFADAADGYGQFLRANPRYSHCFDHKDDPEKFALTLASAGYATDPNYAMKLIAIMRQHKLEQYDQVSA